MTDTNMPAAEAEHGMEELEELQSYELAFHILPTVAEGEVSGIFDAIKAHITKHGGSLQSEEAPARFDLAYDIVKLLEGKGRKFSSAYFGWVRFELEASKINALTEEVEQVKEILRHILIRLNKVEAENPFYFHPSIADRVVETIIIPEAVIEEVVEEVPLEEAEIAEKPVDGEDAAETV